MKNFNNPRISVIVPIYNTEKYLAKCIKSILNQTYKNFELLLIIDGSPDMSLEICEKFEEKDNRIIIINKANEGLEKTRRVGILHSKGEYITHVDSDDWLHKTALEKMIIAADSSKADIVIAKYFRVMDRYGVFQKASPYNIPNDLILDSQSFIRDYFIGFFGVNRFSISMWAKLYKKSFIDKIEITIGGFDLGEDLNYNIQVFPKANIIHFIDSPIYFYRFGGMTTKLNEKIIESALSMFNLKKKMIVEYNKPEYNKWIIIEMVNYIKSFVKMMIEYKRNDPVFINTSLNELFSRPEIYDVIEYSRNLENFKNDNFVKALQRQDIDTMLEIQAVVYKKEKFRKSLIRTVSNCLK